MPREMRPDSRVLVLWPVEETRPCWRAMMEPIMRVDQAAAVVLVVVVVVLLPLVPEGV